MYNVEVSTAAAKELGRIKRADAKVYSQIVKAIAGLSEQPRPDGCTKLSGREGYRIRVRDYRILYTINDGELLVLIVKVGQRGGVYG